MKGFTIGIRGKIVLTSALIAVLGVASVAALLTWQAPPGGWTAYVWRRDVTRGEDWQRLPLGVPGPSWKAEGLVDGETYEFRLQMAKGTSESQVYSNVVSVVPAS